MTSIADLYALQEIDSALQKSRAGIEEIDKGLGETDELRDARALVAEKRDALRKAEHAAKEAEFEADEQRRKIEPVEEKLYQGKITNPKELEDLQLDLTSLQKRRAELDDRALKAIDDVEAAQKALDDAQSQLEQVGGAFDDDQRDKEERRAGLVEAVATLEAQRAEAAEGIDAALAALYDKLIANRGGRAVAKVEGGSCGGCRISLPMNVLQRARNSRTNVVQCSSCERILYVS